MPRAVNCADLFYHCSPRRNIAVDSGKGLENRVLRTG
jgi:hypothetical protein